MVVEYVAVRPRLSVTVTASVKDPATDNAFVAVKDAAVYVTPSNVVR